MTLKKYFLVCLLVIMPNSMISLLHASEATTEALFEALANAPDELSATTYANEIWNQWFDSGNEQVDQLMQVAMQKRRNYDFNGSIEALNEAIQLKPDFAEAWNQRATMLFMQEKHEASLQDIAKTLALEPRHFGALAGRAVIRLYQSKPALARQNIIEALKIHPFLKERNYFPNLSKKP